MKKSVLLTLYLILCVFISSSLAVEVSMFGPKQYVRTDGAPDTYSDTFEAIPGTGMLIVKNGQIDGNNRIIDATSSARVTVDGVEIFGPNDFNQNVYLLESPVNLAENSTLTVELWSQPGSYLTIEVVQDVPLPTVIINADPAGIISGETATLTWTSTDADSCMIEPGIGTVDTNGAISVSPIETTTYTVTATNRAGSATASATVTVYQPPTVSLSADPDGILLGQSSTLTWTSTNADSATIDQGVGTVAVNGSTAVSPTETTTYTITVIGPGGTETASVTVTVTSPLPTVSITADLDTIQVGGSVTLAWNSTNADSVTIDHGIGAVPENGSIMVSPLETTTYTITATSLVGQAAAEVTVTVTHPVPSASISATPGAIQIGESATLAWTATHTDSCVIEPGVGGVPENGETSVSPGQTTTYTLTANGPGGTSNDSVTVEVNYPVPNVNISVTPEIILVGESAILSWNSAYADSCAIEPDIGTVDTSGSITVSPGQTTTYTITAIGPGGTASVQTALMVTGEVLPQPEGAFGEPYEDLVPPDGTVGQYNPKRFSLITGLVQGIGASPISDVSISINDHPEYGTARTDAEGRFTIPVEGGGSLTVYYQKDGLLSAQRTLYVHNNDIAIAETIQMITEDPVSTTLTFDGNPDTIITHQSSEVNDEFGSRACTLVFRGDNLAYEVDAQGNVIQTLTSITTRATEFTTPASMPAILPPNSAYTYCVELGVDGAQRVKFDNAVITWVDNFLGFDVGEIVPVGYYDRDRGVWVPSDNGIVVKLLDTDADGIVDALDADGDDVPDDLDENGSLDDEVTGLNDSAAYTPGATFWRVAVTHFTPYDYNWPLALPSDATDPNPRGKSQVDQKKPEEQDCKQYTNSYVEERSRIFHEDIPVPGTGMTLHYASNRVEGYRYRIVVPASGETVPASLKRIIIRANVSGRTYEQTLDPLPNQTAEIIWDGLDHLGKSVANSTSARISIGFVYDIFYASSRNCGTWEQVFAQPGCQTTGILARQEKILWKRSDSLIHREAKGTGTIAEGWTLSAHHALSPVDPSTLHKGDGTITTNAPSIIKAFAGTGIYGYSGDGGDALDAQIGDCDSIAFDAFGNLYIADTYVGLIRKVDVNGIITTFAGGGNPPDGVGDGGIATQALLSEVRGIAVDSSGNLYIADRGNDRIRKVDRNGIITTVAGGGNPPDGFGDNGPATEAALNCPYDVAVDAFGSLYIADTGNHCIRKVDPNGIITMVAGTVVEEEGGGEIPPPPLPPPPSGPIKVGVCGYGGDGGPAIQALLAQPEGIAVDALGNLYIADKYNHRIRKVDASGIITTVAGSGYIRYAGDGGPATEAGFRRPSGVAVDNSGNLYIADAEDYRIRKVDTNGIITTVAGSGIGDYYSGKGGFSATEITLNWPTGVAVDAAGDLYIADFYNTRVWKVAVPSAFVNLMSAGEMLFAEENGLAHIVNSAGRHRSTIDVDTGATLYEFAYDEDQKLVSVIDRFGNETTVERDAAGKPIAITSPDGVRTILEIDADNHLTTITYPDGSNYDFEYTADGLLTAKIEPEGNRFEQLFDSEGRLIDLTDQEGGHWHYTTVMEEDGDIRTEALTGEGDLTTYLDHMDSTGDYTSYITDPSGAQAVYTCSSDGLSETKSLACGMELSLKYGIESRNKIKYIKEMREKTPSSLEKVTLRDKSFQDINSDGTADVITETVSVNGKVETFEINTSETKKTTTSPEGRTLVILYDPLTLQPQKRTPLGLYETIYGYDSQGRQTSIQTEARQTSFTYDDNGYLASSTDSEGNTTAYNHDAVGRMTLIDRPDGSSVEFFYDGNGNMTVLANPSEIAHGFGYNGVNLKTAYQTPLSGSYGYLYDKDRRLIQTTFPSGARINNVYSLGRLIQVQTPEGNIDYTYLCSSKVDSITSGAEAIAYGYDGALVISASLSGTLNQSLSYEYNSDFKLASATYAGATYYFNYDDDGLLSRSGSFYIIRNTQTGLPESVTGGNLDLSRTFNGYGEVEAQDTTVSGLAIASWSLARDNSGRIINKTETVGGIASTYAYTYNPMGRLLTVTKDGSLVEEYEYSINGTRIYETNTLRGISGKVFDYSDEGHLLLAGITAYQYDVDGFLTTRTQDTAITTYDYSSRGELLIVTLPDGTALEYVHDPLGRRIAKKVNGIITEKYLWQGHTRLLAVYDGSDTLKMRFDYADGRMPVSMTKDGNTYYLTYDQVGSLRIVADASGNVARQISYDSFGNIISDTNPAFEIPFGFAGGLYEPDTGLVRFGARDYDPDIGRWTAKDPLLFNGGDVDLYGYCINNPVNFSDPDGKTLWEFGSGSESGRISPHILSYFLDDINKTGNRTPTRGNMPNIPTSTSQLVKSRPCETVVQGRYGPFATSGPFDYIFGFSASDSVWEGDAGYVWDSSPNETNTGGGYPGVAGASITVSNVEVSNLWTDSVTITWTTDQLSDSMVQYGLTSSYGSTSPDATLTKTHSITLTNLSWGTTYHFRILSTNIRGYSDTSEDFTFTTLSSIPLIVLEITSPLDGETINRPDVMVKGKVINTSGYETGVAVNGIVAMIYGDELVANHVPLQEGANTITASAIDIEENSLETSVTVNTIAEENYVLLTAAEYEGVSPFETKMNIEATFDIVESELFYAGPGTVEVLDMPSSTEYMLRITGPGIYYFTAEATDNDSNTYEDIIGVVVLDEAITDGAIRARWNAMKEKLLQGDIMGALEFYNPLTRHDYEMTYTALGDELPGQVAALGEIEKVYIRGDTAKYKFRREEVVDGQTYNIAYHIYFIRDIFGRWYVDIF